MNNSRRDFIKNSALATLVVSIPNPLFASKSFSEMKNKDFENAYLTIDSNGNIVATLPTSEMGQGTQSAQVIILSEELGVFPESVKIDMPLRPSKPYRLFFGQMRSVGSYGVRAWYDPLRIAAARAREMLIKSANLQYDIPISQLDTKDGFVIHKTSNQKFRFGDLVKTASTLGEPKKPSLRNKNNRKIKMSDKRRIDLDNKINGKAVFGTDIEILNMLHGAVKMSPVYKAEAINIDRSSIANMEGVVDVVKVPNGVVVIADTWWGAKKAADKLKVEFSKTSNDNLSSQELSLAMIDGFNKNMPKVMSKGEPFKVLKQQKNITESTYEVPFLTHICMEPLVCTAYEEKDHVTLWMSTQGHDIVRMTVEKVCGLKNDQMTLHTTYIGGGFGRKTHGEMAHQAILASRAVKRPVKVMWSREDDIQQGYYRPIMMSKLKAGVDDKGKIQAMHIQLSGPQMGRTFEHVTVRDNDDLFSVAVHKQQPYADNFQLDHLHLDVPMPLSPWRAVSSSQNGYFLESFIDELAVKTNIDPIEFRKLNLKGHKRHLAVLEKVEEISNWRQKSKDGFYKGVAVVESYGSVIAQVVELSMEDNLPKVYKVYVAIDCGWALQPDSVVAQMEGSVIEGLSAAMYHEVSIENGRATKSNFDNYPFIRLEQTPQIEVAIVDTGAPMGGVGEPGIPPLAPALTNAIYSATKKRIKKLPVMSNISA